jgi:hypothetical protein
MAEYFSTEAWEKKESSLKPYSAMTAVVEIMNFNFLIEQGKFDSILSFYKDIANEMYNIKMRDYNYGLNLLEPEIKIQSDRIYLYSHLYFEKNLTDLSSMVFKKFVELCNLIVSVALKQDIVLRGFAGIDEITQAELSSGNLKQSEKKDNLLHSDMLKVFSFNEIFPEGLDQVFIPPVSIPMFLCTNFLNADSYLSEITAVGIYLPIETGNSPSSEVAIYSGLLYETILDGKKVFAVNCFEWAQKHLDVFPTEAIKERISLKASDKDNKFAHYWKKFNALP